MLTLDTISSPVWTRKKSKRLWRWNSSGKWTFSGRGCKWQNARAGGWVPDWFEGGQTPLFRRMPKMRGFSNAVFTKHYNIINLQDIEKLISLWITKIDKQTLLDSKLIRRKSLPVKLLWVGTLSKSIEIEVDIASKSATQAIKDTGGTLTLLQA